jgi:hypothetical protein
MSNFFQAYLDESGTHEESSILAVAGYFGTQPQWDKFLEHWPNRDFHACEARFDCMKQNLVDAIESAQLEGVEVCLRPWEFRRQASNDLKSTIGNGYAICAFMCAVRICELICREDPMARVSLVLEDGQPNVEWVRRFLLMMMHDYPIASVTVAKKADVPLLHTADFLSHSRTATDKPWMDKLFAKNRVWEQKVEGDQLLDVSRDVAKILKDNRRAKARSRAEKR